MFNDVVVSDVETEVAVFVELAELAVLALWNESEPAYAAGLVSAIARNIYTYGR